MEISLDELNYILSNASLSNTFQFIDVRMLIDFNKSRIKNAIQLNNNPDAVLFYMSYELFKKLKKNIIIVGYDHLHIMYICKFLEKLNTEYNTGYKIHLFYKFDKINKIYLDLSIKYPFRHDMTKINNFIFLGDQIDGENLKLLKENNIKYILNCGLEQSNNFSDPKYNFTYLKLSAIDSTDFNIIKYFPKSYDFIEKCRKENCNILIHCFAGISRSVTILISYIMRQYVERFNYNPRLILNYIKNKKPNAQPNEQFIKDLTAYGKILIKLSEE